VDPEPEGARAAISTASPRLKLAARKEFYDDFNVAELEAITRFLKRFDR
jgi:hypothetical protein